MKNCVSIQVAASGSGVLAGAGAGAAWFRSTWETCESARPTEIHLDFSAVVVATGSWLREAIVAFVRRARSACPHFSVVAVRVTEQVREELDFVLKASNEVLIELSETSGHEVALVLGRLDPALRETLEAAIKLERIDANSICRELPILTPSAANNRLAALEERGVLVSRRVGRTRQYKKPFEGIKIWA